MSESIRHLREGFGEVGDIWRHEALKKGAETALYYLGRNQAGRLLLSSFVRTDGVYDPRLATSIGGIELDGPTGIAPGWDKRGKTILGWQAAGAHHITVGGIPPFRQPGNRMPRLHTFDERLGDHGHSISINSFGFNSDGSDGVVGNLDEQHERGEVKIKVIGQVTMNKQFYDEDKRHRIPGLIADTVRKLRPHVDAIGLGLSSPNTLTMRNAQDEWGYTYDNVRAAQDAAEGLPVVYKGDGDGGQRRNDMYCRLIAETGVIMELINTTALDGIKGKYVSPDFPGGLAGADPDYQQLAEDSVRYVYEETGGEIIGVGGINSPEQALKMLRAGASAISVNTLVRSKGLHVVRFLEDGMSHYFDSQPIESRSVKRIIGADTARGPKYPLAA